MELFSRTRGEGFPVIMLHGLFGSADNLGALSRQLETEYRVIGVDLRNHGRSPHINTMTYPEMAEDVLRVMDREGIERAHVFGHSMGGKTAMQLALTAGERVKKLIVGDIAPVAYSHGHGRILEGMAYLQGQAPDSRGLAQDMLAPFIDEDGVLSFLMTNWRRRDDGSWGWRLNLDAIIDQYEEIVGSILGQSHNGETLFIRGANSHYIIPEYRDAILALFPNASVRTIEGTGHWFHAEKPDLTARIVLRFLKDSE